MAEATWRVVQAGCYLLVFSFIGFLSASHVAEPLPSLSLPFSPNPVMRSLRPIRPQFLNPITLSSFGSEFGSIEMSKRQRFWRTTSRYGFGISAERSFTRSKMAAKFLPQAMVMLPRSGGPTKLRFRMASTSVNWKPSSVSKVRLGTNGQILKPIVAFRAGAKAGEGGGVSETAPEEEVVVSECSGEPSETGEAVVKAVRTPRVKLGDVLGILNKKAIEASDALRPIPDLRTGDIVEIKLEVPENRRRLSIYKGIVI